MTSVQHLLFGYCLKFYYLIGPERWLQLNGHDRSGHKCKIILESFVIHNHLPIRREKFSSNIQIENSGHNFKHGRKYKLIQHYCHHCCHQMLNKYMIPVYMFMM